jgi:hypothetical protein
MATYEGRLTKCYTDGLEGNGPFVCRRGRHYGGVKFFGDRWMAFDEAAADMAAINRGVELGHLELRDVKAEAPAEPKEKKSENKTPAGGKGRGRGSSKTRGKQ